MATSPEPARRDQPPVARFGGFDLNLQTGELSKEGTKNRLQGQPLQLLELFLQKPGQLVTREQIRQHLWPDGTVVEFEHSVNAAIKRLREALHDDADKPTFVETIPSRGYRFIARVENRDVPASARSSALEDAVVDPHHARRRWLAGAAVTGVTALVLVVLSFALRGLRQWVQEKTARPEIQSLAVLPLENLSGDPAQEYFADGMTDALITDLAHISSLRVISRTSAMSYKGVKKPLPEIARELNVDAVVEGSVVRGSNRVRITAQLIQAVPERHLWASAYERELADVVELEGDVARAIASEVQVKLTTQEQARLVSPRPAANPEAYEAYLRGRSLLFSSREKAAAYFETAIKKDPTYAPAFAGLSYSYSRRSTDSLPGREAMALAEAAALKALALDETLAEAHAALGIVKYRYQWDWRGAEAEFRRAIALNPNFAEGHRSYSTYLLVLRRFPEALSEMERAYALDPLNRGIHTELALNLECLRRYDEATAESEKALDADPQDAGALRLIGLMQLEKGQAREAIASLEQGVIASKRAANSLAALGYGYAVTGKRDQALEILRELESQSRQRYVSPVYMAFVHVGLGNKEQALVCLERAYDDHDELLVGIYYRHMFEPLHSHPQFHSLLRRMGFPPLPD